MAADDALWEKRPTWLSEIISTSFETVSDPSFSGYHILASEEYAFGDIPGSDLVATCVADLQDSQALNAPLRLLDIGAGEGRFLETMHRQFGRERLQAVAVSALVYNASLASTATFESRTLNAECLLTSQAFQRDILVGKLYDCIVSAETFRHFQDPLGTLCQVFLLLRSGGVLAVDRLHVTGLGSGQQLLDWWQEAGFEVYGEVSGERIAPLLLRRSSEKQQLQVPVRYAQRLPGEANATAVYAFRESRADCLENGNHAGSGLSPLKLPPPWSRIKRSNKAPPAQWRQIEGLLRQLAKK